MSDYTTKSPQWRRSRTKLGSRGNVISVKDICALFDVTGTTAARWAAAGKLGAERASSAVHSPWRFSIDKVREELGMDPLEPEVFSPDNPSPAKAKKGPRRGRAR